MPRFQILLQLSWNIGTTAFIGGWLIFFLWFCARYLFGYDFEIMEFIGFLWLNIFFWLGLIGLLSLLVYIIFNLKHMHLKMLFTGLMILINITSVLAIMRFHGKINDRVFVKLKNQTGIENYEFQLQGNLKSWKIGQIDNGSSKIFNYGPPYKLNDARKYQLPDSLTLVLIKEGKIDTVGFPRLQMGECKHLILDENFILRIK